MLIYHQNDLIVEKHTCCCLSECGEDEVLGDDAVDLFLADFEGVCKTHISCDTIDKIWTACFFM